MESYGIAAFRSRQAVLRFEEMLRRAGVQVMDEEELEQALSDNRLR